MTVVTYTRDAKCKDCVHISLKYFGKRKRYICDKFEPLMKGKESKICRDGYEPRREYHIKTIK